VNEPVPNDESELNLPSISDIINDIPSPIPTPVSKPISAPAPVPQPSFRVETPEPPVTEFNKQAVDVSALETRLSAPLAETRVISRESSPPIPVRDLLLDETVKHEVDELEVTAPSKVNRPVTPARSATLDETVKHDVEELDVTALSRANRPVTPARPPQPGELDETRPHSITEVAGRVIMEPASPGLYQLNYACLLVPRFNSHYLTGDLAARMGEWLPNICIAFGWRLEFVAIRPEYMQWVVSVPPNTSPGYLMRIMRQQTSEKIFAEFPRMKRENPSGDFWAPGYLIMGGTQPHPQQLVKDYIKQTRDRQGISQPRK
jgi:REP element-mobilizing transposase RayT